MKSCLSGIVGRFRVNFTELSMQFRGDVDMQKAVPTRLIRDSLRVPCEREFDYPREKITLSKSGETENSIFFGRQRKCTISCQFIVPWWVIYL